MGWEERQQDMKNFARSLGTKVWLGCLGRRRVCFEGKGIGGAVVVVVVE
jgi:hypothetical protein